MLGLPSTPGPVGGVLLAIGLIAAALLAYAVRDRADSTVQRVFLTALVLTVGAAPFLVWRIVEDIRYTTGLNQDELSGAGPIQVFLQPYLLDDVPPLVPVTDTYAAVVGDAVPYEGARKGFPSLALNVLFPRVSVARPEDADWVVAWGVDPRRVAPVSRVIVARQRSGPYPPVYVGRVMR